MVGDGTRCVHGGYPAAEPGAPLHPAPVLTSAFHLGVPGDPLPRDFYGRVDNPTWRALESAIGELDGGECVLFSSGMAAISAVLRTTARPGRAVVLPADGYHLARTLAEEELAPLGVPVRTVPTAGYWGGAVLEGASLVLLETPSNPGLEVCDIAAVAALAHAAGALVAVDNTTATPLGQHPLELGADLVVSSDTKAVSGHGDVVLGHVSAADPVLVGRLRAARSRGGAVPGPLETWLAHRGLGTLDLRLERQAANARAVATALRGHPAVSDVRWPGLEDDPAHAVAARQMRRWNGVLRFTLASAAAVARFLEASRLVCSATSFGGLRTSADRRERWGDAVPPGLVRLSAGCEDATDLVADVLAALDAVGR
ncbi:cystathionine gamma-lyase [Pseudonocardia hispaniensis]|uniref:Cystathionine gamma-lyase n=1 Tax=Pseudonocardia hispaniensis TaxID=904933 RepID=A0ABW1J894_9PSEU